jgi:hypothetical protein
LEIAPAAINIAGGGIRRLEARAFDETGRALAVPAEAVRWEAAPEVGAIERDGTLRATAGTGSGVVTATLLGVQAAALVRVGTLLRPLDGFENGAIWTAATAPATVPGTVALVSDRARTGAKALKLAFDFTTTTATRAVYAKAVRPIGAPVALRLWLHGDPAGAWLRARLRDAGGQMHLVDFGRKLEPVAEWRELVASIPEGAPGPFTLDSIYLVQPDPLVKGKGAVYVDDLSAEYAAVD